MLNISMALGLDLALVLSSEITIVEVGKKIEGDATGLLLDDSNASGK